jgi:uncharacterized protein YaiL (DUF2058 family)
VIARRKPVSQEAGQKFAADEALAARFDELLAAARTAEQELRDGEAASAPLAERHRLAKRLDAALTDAMRAAYAAERAAIGPQGYDDRIYRRKARATSPVRAWSAEAERLLTLRESHRLTGIPRVPRRPASGGSDELAPGFQPAGAGPVTTG